MESEVHRRGHRLPGSGGDLQRLPAQGAVHGQQAGSPTPSLLLGSVSGASARLPRDRGVPDGDAQAGGVGGAALRRGEGLARPAPLSVTRAVESELRGAPGSSGAEPQTMALQDRMGTAPRTGWEPGAPPPYLDRVHLTSSPPNSPTGSWWISQQAEPLS